MIVRNGLRGVCGDPAATREFTRIGVLEGAPEYQFGNNLDLAVDAEGGVYVFDGQVPALRY